MKKRFVTLKDKTYAGAQDRYGAITQEVRDRIEKELAIIREKRFAHYFLVVEEIVTARRPARAAAVQSPRQSFRTVSRSPMWIRSSTTSSSSGFSIPAGKTHRTSTSIFPGTSATTFWSGCSSNTASARPPWWRTRIASVSAPPSAKSQRCTACRLKKSAGCRRTLYVKKISSDFPLRRPTSNGFTGSRRILTIESALARDPGSGTKGTKPFSPSLHALRRSRHRAG